jgi:hypothetical protein
MSKLTKPLQLTISRTRQVTDLSATIVVFSKPLERLFYVISFTRTSIGFDCFGYVSEDTTSNSKGDLKF